jgi:hypothetical protein
MIGIVDVDLECPRCSGIPLSLTVEHSEDKIEIHISCKCGWNESYLVDQGKKGRR